MEIPIRRGLPESNNLILFLLNLLCQSNLKHHLKLLSCTESIFTP